MKLGYKHQFQKEEEVLPNAKNTRELVKGWE
jgi:hypothetical protein